MATSSYLPSYFTAMLAAYYIEKGVWKHLAKVAQTISGFFWITVTDIFDIFSLQTMKHYQWIIPIAICNLTIQFSPAMTNHFDIVPPFLYPVFIVANRLIVAIEMVLVFIYISLLEEKNKLNPPAKKTDENNNNYSTTPEAIADCNNDGAAIVKLVGTERYSVLKCFFRLSFAIYMSNYLYIRTDFFTERNIFYNSLYVYVS